MAFFSRARCAFEGGGDFQCDDNSSDHGVDFDLELHVGNDRIQMQARIMSKLAYIHST